MPMQVNIHTTVNNAAIRREKHNGRDHVILPSYTLPANVVMNGGLYPSAEIDAHFHKLENTFAPLGHPTIDGKHVSAFSPEAVNSNYVGAWNRNVKKVGHRVYAEKWIDTAMAASTEGGRRLLERIEAIERGEDVPPIHTSVAAFLDREPAPAGAEGYEWIARIKEFDHDAILLDEPGAATPEQGVGLMVNSADAKPLEANAGALLGESYREKEQRIAEAARTKFGDRYIWVADFTDSQAVIITTDDGDPRIFGYKIEAGNVVFDGEGLPVKRQESWALKINSLFSRFFNKPPAAPAEDQTMPMSAEEKQEIAQMVANAIKPVSDQVAAIATKTEAIEQNLTANARAAETQQRALVAKHFGQVVADGLTGNALAEMAAKCPAENAGSAAPLAPNSAAGAGGDKGPDFSAVVD